MNAMNATKKEKSILSRVLSHGKKERGAVWLLCAISAGNALIGVGVALVIRSLIDSAVGGQEETFYSVALLLGGISLLQLLLRASGIYLREQIGARLTAAYRKHYFSLSLSKSYPAVIARHSGQVMQRLTEDVAAIARAQTVMLPELVTWSVQMVGAAAILIATDPRFALLYLAAGAIVCIPVRLLVGRMKTLHRAVLDADGESRAVLTETLSAMPEIRAMRAENTVAARLADKLGGFLAAKKTQSRFSAGGNFGYGLLMRCGYLLGLIWCGVGILQGTITFGTLTAVQQLIGKIQTPISGISGLFARYAALLASAQRLWEMETDPDEKRLLPEGTIRSVRDRFEVLRIENLHFTYPENEGNERTAVLKGLNLTLRRGEKIAICGESGIGKSTLVRLLLGLYEPDAGSITVMLGGQTYEVGPDTRDLFAYVPQDPTLFSGTVRENLTLFCGELPPKRLTWALETACCDFLSSLPDGLETKIGENGVGLSQGQGQRLAIARALLTDAPILLFDEATSALDVGTEARLIERLACLENKSGIFVTHREAVLGICEKTVTIGQKSDLA